MRKFLGKYKWLLGIELVGVLLCLAACLQPEKLVFSADAEELAARMQETGRSDYYYSGDISLSPGVYILRITGGDHEGTLYPNVQAWESGFQALRCNGVTMYAHQRNTEFEVYVTGRIDRAYVSCQFDQEAGQPIESICLYRTGIGWRMLAFLLLLAATCLNLLIWFREGILSGRIGREQEIVVWTLAASVLLAYLPNAVDYFNPGADGAFHLMRIEGLKETLLHGDQFPVRVQEYWLCGHGYAVSSFCGDLFLLFPALLRMIGFSLMDAYKFFVMAILVGTAWIAYYSFYQCTGNRYSALAGSVLYQIAPYHIYNLYNQNAVGEVMGMMFLPLVVYGFCRMYKEDAKSPAYGRAKIPLIVGLSCILQCHLLVCGMSVLGLAAACLVRWRKTFRRETLLELAKAALWCLALNAWFWVNLLQMLSVDHYTLSDVVSQNIQYMGTELAGALQLYSYMGGSPAGMYNGAPIQAGAAFWAMIFCYVVLRLWRRGQKGDVAWVNPYDRMVGCGVLVSLLTLFLSTRYFPWDSLAAIPVLGMLAKAVQFPARLLGMTTLFGAFTAAYFVLWLLKEGKCRGQRVGGGIAACCFAGITAIALLSTLFHVNEIAFNSRSLRLYNAEHIGTGHVVDGEYLLAGMETRLNALGYHDPVAQEGLLWDHYSKEGLTMALDVDNATEEEKYLELPVTGYRGYAVQAEPEAGSRGLSPGADPYITQERGDHGDLRIAVPAGYSGRIQVFYRGFVLSRWGELLSVLALAALFVRWGLRRHTRRSGGKLSRRH